MRRYLPLVLVFVLLISCEKPADKKPASPVLTTASPQAGGFSAERLARLDSGMNEWVKKNWVNGSVALIARKGKIVFHKAYGYNDPETKTPLDKDGIFRIASQTKAITTVAALMLWEQGKFGLDDPVSLYIPTFANQVVLDKFNPKDTSYTSVPAKRLITIRDLLTHTSGIGYPAIGTPEANSIYAKARITGGVGTKGQQLSDAMTRLGTVPLMFQPGEKWMYGVNTDLLGYLIEIWSGKTLEQFFSEQIFTPLGMKDTYFNVPQDKASRLVNFFQEGEGGTIKKQDRVFGGALDMNFPVQQHDYFSGGGGLSSTVTDYAIFLQMLLNNGEYNGVRYLSRNSIRLMTMNQIGDLTIDGQHKFSFGFRLVDENTARLSPSQAGTYSWGGAFSTSYWVDPKEEMICIIYRQMWGSKVALTDKAFKPLVYQAIND